MLAGGGCAERASTRGRAAALGEVLVAFVLVHVSWRAFKNFTWLGKLETSAHLNFSPGLLMIGFTVLAVRLHGCALSDFGLTLTNWRKNLNVGIACGVLEIVMFASVMLASGFRPADRVHPGTPWSLAIVGAAMALLFSLLLLAILRRPRAAFLVPPTVSVPILFFLWSLPILAAMFFHRPVGPMAGTVGWMIIGAGFGEEIFFRGYVQTRLDLAFGKPIALAGLRFGTGLIVSSLLFGLVHALNTVDYFRGQYHFNWPSGLFNAFAGVAFAVLREKTGSIFPGAIAHSLGDVLERLGG